MERMMIHEIPGFSFGQVQDLAAGPGCTVILCPEGGVTGVDVRGGSPGTRDTDALNPVCNREVVHAVVLTGGSAFGLDAAGGVMKKLEEVGVGRDVMVTVVPNVCAAVLFDLKFGSMEIRPWSHGLRMAALRELPFQEGNFGAGTGCTIGKIRGAQFSMKGGIGACAFRQGDLMVGAVVACNAMGDVLENGTILAGARDDSGRGFADSEAWLVAHGQRQRDVFSGKLVGENTVIGCVVTNAAMNKAQATKLAAVPGPKNPRRQTPPLTCVCHVPWHGPGGPGRSGDSEPERWKRPLSVAKAAETSMAGLPFGICEENRNPELERKEHAELRLSMEEFAQEIKEVIHQVKTADSAQPGCP